MAAAIKRFDGSTVHSASAAFGSVAAAAGGSGVDVFENDRLLVALWGRVRFTDIELAALAQRHGVASALAQGYKRKGSGVLAALSGPCALAILDGRGGEAVLAIDRMGTRPICYCVIAGTLVFAPETMESMTGVVVVFGAAVMAAALTITIHRLATRKPADDSGARQRSKTATRH